MASILIDSGQNWTQCFGRAINRRQAAGKGAKRPWDWVAGRRTAGLLCCMRPYGACSKARPPTPVTENSSQFHTGHLQGLHRACQLLPSWIVTHLPYVQHRQAHKKQRYQTPSLFPRIAGVHVASDQTFSSLCRQVVCTRQQPLLEIAAGYPVDIVAPRVIENFSGQYALVAGGY